MVKFITLTILSLTLFFSNAFAVGNLPSNPVSVAPSNAKPGDPIEIMALIYNNQKETITFSVEFKSGDNLIDKPVVTTISSMSAKTVSIKWKQPEIKTQINVSITSAVDKQRKDLTQLHGIVGFIILGNKEFETVGSLSNISIPDGKIKEVFYNLRDKLEVFRKKEFSHFSILRDKTKIKLNIEVPTEVKDSITPDFATSESQIDKSDDVTLGYLEKENLDNPMDYGTLVYATALASLFGSIIMFYTALILILFLILRVLFKMFI